MMIFAALPSGIDFSRLAHLDAARTIRTLQDLAVDPMSNPPLALLSVAAVALILLIIVAALLLIATPGKRTVVITRTRAKTRDEFETGSEPFRSLLEGEPAAEVPEAIGEPVEAPAAAKSTRWADVVLMLTGPWMIVLLVVVALLLGYGMTTTDQFCARTCHASSKSVQAAAGVKHASCVACHEGSGVSGFAGAVSDRARWAVGEIKGVDQESISANVDSRSCLRCHSSIKTGIVVVRGVRVSHKEIIDSGRTCTSCHVQVGHTKRTATGSMSACLPCHDGVKAAAGCALCHTKGAPGKVFASTESSATLGKGLVNYPVVDAAKRDCGACHDLATRCDPCHGGVRMPHSDAYRLKGMHARDAAFDGKQRCWKCHTVVQCNGCHINIEPTGVSNHAEDFAITHRKESTSSSCPCHVQFRAQKGLPPRASMCSLCH